MIRRLRSRFIRIAMEALVAVLLVLLLGVNLVNRMNVYSGIDRRLSYLAASNLGPPDGMLASTPQEIRRWVELNDAGVMSEASYFILSGYMTPNVRDGELDMLSLVTGRDAYALLGDILHGTQSHGDVAGYRYYAAERGAAFKVVFLNCENEFAAMRSLLHSSILVGATCLIVVFALVVLLSDRAVQPFAENIENQKRFISNASHELKTPLGVIMSDLDLQILESGQTEWLTNAQVQADHLAMLIERLTAYSLLGERRRETPPVPMDLSELGETVLSDFRPLALSKGQTLRADIAPDILVRADGDAMRVLLSVLLDNAVKYAPEGGLIRLSIRRERRVILETQNTYDGADGAEFEHLFERFYRAPGRRADEGGYGLGLSIAHQIVTLCGGTIRARAADGFALFTAELPL